MEQQEPEGCCKGIKEIFIEGWDLLKIVWSNKYINDERMQNIYKGLYIRAYVSLIAIWIEIYTPNSYETRLA